MTLNARKDPTECHVGDEAQYIEILDNFYEQGSEALWHDGCGGY